MRYRRAFAVIARNEAISLYVVFARQEWLSVFVIVRHEVNSLFSVIGSRKQSAVMRFRRLPRKPLSTSCKIISFLFQRFSRNDESTLFPSLERWVTVGLLPSLRGTKQSPCVSSLRSRNDPRFSSLRGTKQSPCMSSLLGSILPLQALEDCHENPFQLLTK